MLTTYVNLPANPDTDLLDVNLAGVELARFGVLPYTTMAISYADLGTAGAAWIADLQWSDNAVDWFAFATPVQIGPGAGVFYVTPVDVSDCAFVRLVVTTGEGSSKLVRVAVCAKGPSTISAETNLGMGQDKTIINVSNDDIYRNNSFYLPCAKFSKMSATASNASPDVAWSVAKLAVQWSNNRVDWYEFPSPIYLNGSIPSLSNIDISTFSFVRFYCTRTEIDISLRVAVCMKSTS